MATKKTATSKTATSEGKKKTAKQPDDRMRRAAGEQPVKPKRKLSALDAAAKVLAESGEPMNTQQMIEVMAAKKYWASPAGKTPHATLFAAIIREIKLRGKDARFQKIERGKFALNKP